MSKIQHEQIFFGELNNKSIELTKEYAKKVYTCETNDDYSLTEYQLRNIVSKYYKIPIFSPYFENLTIMQLIFEVELITLSTQTAEQRNQALMESPEAKQEMATLFDDWDEEDNQWSNVQEPDKKQLDETVSNFVNNNKFVGEE